MELARTNPQDTSSKNQTFQNSVFNQRSSVSVILGVILLLIIVSGGAYFLGTKQTKINSQTITNTQLTPEKTNVIETKLSENLNNIVYLIRYTPLSYISRGSQETKTVYITRDETGESLKIADENMSVNSIKTIYEFKSPSALGFYPPLYNVYEYIVAPVVGADANDLLIFNFSTGKVVSDGLRTNNSELNNWIISYGEIIKNTIIKINLFKIDNSIATAQVDVSTGKMVPGSFASLGKFQQ